MIRLKNSFLIALFAFLVVPMHGMQSLKKIMPGLRKKAYEVLNVNMQAYCDELGVNSDATTKEIEDAYTAKLNTIKAEHKKKITEIDDVYKQETNTDEYNRIKRQYLRDSALLHPDKQANRTDDEIRNLLINRGVAEEKSRGQDRNGLLQLIAEEYEKAKKNHEIPNDKVIHDKHQARVEKIHNKNLAQVARDNLTQYAFFIDLYIIGGLAIGSAVTVAGLIKAWQLFKEYSSPNAILLEKMNLAANKAVTLILNLEFDRYNPTKDTDALSLQFELEPLFAQLSPEVRKKVKQAVIDFDKTLEATYEQCAWHYDGMTFKELATQNPQLVKVMLTRLRLLLEALELCKTDLQLDRNMCWTFLQRLTTKKVNTTNAHV